MSAEDKHTKGKPPVSQPVSRPNQAKPRRGARPRACGELTARQQRFVSEYLIDLNATQAAIRAGYSAKTARAIGAENLTKPDIAAAVTAGRERLAARLEMTAEDVLRHASLIARSDLRRLFDEHGNLLDIDQLPAEVAAAIALVEVVERRVDHTQKAERTRRIRLWDKIAALTLLARYHGLLTDKVEVDGRVGVITPEQARQMSDSEIETKLQEIATEATALAARLT